MGKKILAVILMLVIIGGGLLFLNMQQVTIAVLSGMTSVSGTFGTSEFRLQQVTFSPRVSMSVRNVSRLNYIMMSRGKPMITSSSEIQMPYVVNLTITFSLVTPTGKTLTFEPLKLGKGGVHNFTLIIGPDEGLTETGTFRLTITFSLKVTTPAGVTVVELTKIIEVIFTVPKGSVQVVPRD